MGTACHRLNTSRSIAALAALLHKTELGTNEHSMSAYFLAGTGDPQWFPLLLEVAQRDMKNGNYVYNAAESGEDKMLPVLLPLLNGTDEDSRQDCHFSPCLHRLSRCNTHPSQLAATR